MHVNNYILFLHLCFSEHVGENHYQRIRGFKKCYALYNPRFTYLLTY